MNKIIFRILVSSLFLLACFIIYLGSTEVIVNPKFIEKEFKIYDN